MSDHRHRAVGLNGTFLRLPVTNASAYSPITDAEARPRRAIVSIDKCNSCHGNISPHGGNRRGAIEVCAMCHNPNATDVGRRTTPPFVDGKSQAIDFKTMIHTIHGAEFGTENGGKAITIYGFGGNPNTFDHVAFPGILYNCNACHIDSTTGVALAPQIPGSTVDVGADPSDLTDNLRINKTTAVCSSFHAGSISTAHMLQMGGNLSGITQEQIDSVNP